MVSQQSSVAALLPLAALIAIANAHEHHGDAIPEGETISKDPIVRQRYLSMPSHRPKLC